MKNEINNIIFTGGGFKCWAYIGTIRALNEMIQFDKIKMVIGVSCGSVFGLLYLLQFDYTYILNYFLNMDFKNNIDIDIDSILLNQSFLEGKKFKAIVQKILQTKVNENITFKELYDLTGIMYTVVGFNITDVKIEYFNKENTPEIKIIDGIMASTALPLLFPAYNINNKLYYDGGICNNCPCNLIHENEIDNTIIFDISNHTTESKYNLFSLILCVTELLNQQINKNIFIKKYEIIDPKYDNETVNLNQSPDDIFNMYMNGYTKTLQILQF